VIMPVNYASPAKLPLQSVGLFYYASTSYMPVIGATGIWVGNVSVPASTWQLIIGGITGSGFVVLEAVISTNTSGRIQLQYTASGYVFFDVYVTANSSARVNYRPGGTAVGAFMNSGISIWSSVAANISYTLPIMVQYDTA